KGSDVRAASARRAALMTQLNTTQLAERLGKTKARISQYVSEGKLDGCFTGTGRARRFDLEKSVKALGVRLDPGQLMGNGAGTRAALKSLAAEGGEQGDDAPRPGGATELPSGDQARYELARTQKAEEELRRLRRQNHEADGTFVLASQVTSEVRRQMALEISGFESSVLRDGARRIADEMGVDFKQVRAILMAAWREYRGGRTAEKAGEAENAVRSDEEREADI
ncbi:hypothetical protein SAMN04490248_1781, partial [Salinihabitans flavidus]